MKRFVVHAGRVPALESHPEGGFVYYADARAVIDELQALLNERDAALDHCRALLQEWLAAPILQHTEEQADAIDSLEGMTRGALR